MIVNKETIEERLKSPANIVHKGYGKSQNSKPDQPEFLKEVEAGLVIQGESQREIAKAFEVSQPAVSYAFNGKNLNSEGVSRLSSRKSEAQEKALDRLMDALDLMDEDKLSKCKAVDLSAIASNMSKVVEKMEGKANTTNNVLVIYAPKQRDESDFETIAI
jgi:predicted transcriptional regulator